MTHNYSTAEQGIVAEQEDRIPTPIDPLLRNAKVRFIAIIVIACVLHASILAFLLTRDRTKPQEVTEVPVEVIVLPPPQQPPPPPKPPEPKKEAQKPQPKEKPKPKPEYAKPATDLPPPPNKEQVKRDQADEKTQSRVAGTPQPVAVTKPVPNQAKAAPDAAPTPEEKTAAPDLPDQDKPDAEPLSKAEPEKDPKPTQKQKPTKERAPLPTHANSTLAQEFAALEQAPSYSIATPSKPSPVSGGHCGTAPYLCTLFGLIMRQQHYPDTARRLHIEGKVVVAFWIDERGDLVHQAVYRTSGHPELDSEAVAAIRRAAPFPPPPPGAPHGFFAQMEFPQK